MTDGEWREQVRARYAAAAIAAAAPSTSARSLVAADGCGVPSTGGPSAAAADGCGGSGTDEAFGAGPYSAAERGEVPAAALIASLGCGNPLAVAELRAGETVLDLGCGGGIDVLLSAHRVGPTGFVYGVDMTDEMLALARANAAQAGVPNVRFVKGSIEDVPLPDGAVDVVISNCVINLSADKSAVFAEAYRVLAPGGRLGLADVVAGDGLRTAGRIDCGTGDGCIAGALTPQEYLHGLAAAGFVDAEVTLTHEAAPGTHSAIVRAVKPVQPS